MPALFFALLALLEPASARARATADSTGKPGLVRQVVSLPARGAIRFYQLFIADQDLPTCNFEPSCSAFSFESYERTDPLQATLMTFDRLTRCNYWNLGEYPIVDGKLADPVHDHVMWGTLPDTARAAPDTALAVPEGGSDEDGWLDLEADLDLADALALQGRTAIALAEYRRLAHATVPLALRVAALFRQGWLLFQEGRFAEAADAFSEISRAVPEASADAADAAVFVALARSGLGEQSGASSLQGRPVLRYVRAWASIRAGNTEAAREELEGLLQSADAVVARASRHSLALVDSAGPPPTWSAWVSGASSALVPGLGALYTRRYGDATFSFAATGGATFLSLRSARAEHWLNAGLFGTAAAGFYLGNVYGGILSARTENRRARRMLGDSLVARAARDHLLPAQIISHLFSHRLPSKTTAGERFEVRLSGWRAQGDDRFARSQWQEAARSYRRHVQYVPENVRVDSVLFALARSLERTGDEVGARFRFEELLDRYPESGVAEEARIALARLYLRIGAGERARFELEDEIAFGALPERVTEARYLKTWAYLSRHEWHKAQVWLEGLERSQLGQPHRSASRVLAAKLNTRKDRPRRSPRLARVLSTVVPGLGQIYAGETLDGVIAFTLNSAITYSVVRSAQARNWLDTALIGGLLFHRFYAGNTYNAQRYSHAYNEAQDARLIQEIRADVRSLGASLDPLGNPAPE